jgi:pyridoxal phosphate enzyme (YggS family)
VGKVSLIQSVDSSRLLSAISKEAVRQGITQDVLLEINVGHEESKSGFEAADICALLENLPDFPGIRVRGLMAIPPICENKGDNNKFFQEISQLAVDITRKKYDNVCMEILSMGMSGDFADAIACGSTMIRVGTAIFGARDYTKPHQA